MGSPRQPAYLTTIVVDKKTNSSRALLETTRDSDLRSYNEKTDTGEHRGDWKGGVVEEAEVDKETLWWVDCEGGMEAYHPKN